MENNPEQNLNKEQENKQEPIQFMANSRYFTISVYTVIVIFIGVIITKLFMSWHETLKAVQEVFHVLMPFIIGSLIAFILNPAVKKLDHLLHKYLHIKHCGIRKILSIMMTYVFVLGLIAVILFGIVPQLITSITEVLNNIPTMVSQMYSFMDNLEQHFPNMDMDIVRKTINNALPNVLTPITNFASNMVPAFYQISMIVVQWLLNIIIALIVSVYMLFDKKRLQNSLRAIIYALIPTKHIQTVTEIMREGYGLFNSFIIGKSVDSMIIGLLCFLLMTMLGLPYSLLISVIVGVTNMIPYFGPFIGAIPGVVIMLLISPWKALILAILILVLQQFDGLILGPRILGDSTGLRPLWIIIAITVGGSIGGVLGMFLGVPIVAFIRYLLNRFLIYKLKKKKILDENDINLEL